MLCRPGWLMSNRPLSVAVTPPLDVVTGAGAAYSFRKLRAAYAGKALNVQRDSDSTNTDVGFVGNDFDAASYVTFVAAGTGRNRLWYDQANSNLETGHAGSFGLPVTFSHVPADHTRYGAFTTTNDSTYMTSPDAANIQNMWATGGFAAFVARVESIPSGGSNAMVSKGTTAGWGIFVFNNSGTYVVVPYFKGTGDGFAQVANANAISLSTLHVITVSWNATTPAVAPVVTLDGVTCSIASYTPPTGTFASDAAAPLILFNDNILNALADAFGGGLFEVLLYKSIPSGANQATLVSNMRTYYGI